MYQIHLKCLDTNNNIISDFTPPLDSLNDDQKKALFLGFAIATAKSPWRYFNFPQFRKFNTDYKVIVPTIPSSLLTFIKQPDILNSFSKEEKQILLVAAAISNNAELIAALKGDVELRRTL